MPSPFPGMDPFLEDERHWPSFHHAFVESVRQVLRPGLLDRYRATTAVRLYDAESVPAGAGGLRHCSEEYIEIRHAADDRLVTLLDIVSPANKTTAAGREA